MTSKTRGRTCSSPQSSAKAIAAGAYPPGTATPSITALSQEYGHARQTCSKAIGLLVEEGLLRRYPGLGYYVTAGPAETAAGG